MGIDQMFAKSVLFSGSKEGGPDIATLHLRYPRIIHAELMTHRVFSRNARSSRAVPYSRMMAEINSEPFVPWHWTRNQPGMQGEETYSEAEIRGLVHLWMDARDAAVYHSQRMVNTHNPHKQVVNRLLEPFMWIDVLVTATEWRNFIHLRDHKDAEPHLRDLAQMVAETLSHGPEQMLGLGEWHLPYVTADDVLKTNEDIARKLSVVRSARISYAPFDGQDTLEKELARYEKLCSDPMHASPFEHQATPDMLIRGTYGSPDLHGNLVGWVQNRKLIPNEAIRG